MGDTNPFLLTNTSYKGLSIPKSRMRLFYQFHYGRRANKDDRFCYSICGIQEDAKRDEMTYDFHLIISLSLSAC